MTKPSIRPAVPQDALIASHLIYMSMGRLADFLFGSNNPVKAKNVLRDLFLQQRNRFAYPFTDVLEVNNAPAGLLQSYSGQMMQQLARPMGRQMLALNGLAAFVQFLWKSLPLAVIREVETDEYFINTVAVLPGFQGQGIGTHLLLYAEEKAKEQDLLKCSLSVAIDNDRARALYESLGYQVVKTTRLSRMERQIGYKGIQRMVKVLG